MGMIYWGFTSNLYTSLKLSGSGYPSGTTIRGSYDASVNPEGQTAGFKGPWNTWKDKIRTITIETPIEVNYGNSLFYDLYAVTTINGFDNIAGSLISGKRMFSGLRSLKNLTYSDGTPMLATFPNLNTAGCVSMEEMFMEFPLQSLDLQHFSLRNCANTSKMFYMSKIKTIDMQQMDTNGVRYSNQMFANCVNLEKIIGTEGHWDFSLTLQSTDMFTGSPKLPNYPGGLDATGAVTCVDSQGQPITGPGHIQIQKAPQIIAKTRIMLRNDTAARWDQFNPVLLKGEAGIDTTTHRLKLGDGITEWKDLPWTGSPNVDDITLKMDQDGMMYANLDYKTIIVNSEGKIAVDYSSSSDLLNFWSNLFN